MSLTRNIDIDPSTATSPLPAATISLVIQATDSSSAALSSQCRLAVHILDVNDHSPVFAMDGVTALHTQPQISISMEEDDVKRGREVLRVSAYDPDWRRANIVYSLEEDVNDEYAAFTVDAQSGVVRAKEPLDFEKKATYAIRVLATDKSGFGMKNSSVLDMKVGVEYI